jgi:hypothetical protein
MQQVARLVRKLREARERSGKLSGRKSYAEARSKTLVLAKKLRRFGKSFSVALHGEGHATCSGKPYSASASAIDARLSAEQGRLTQRLQDADRRPITRTEKRIGAHLGERRLDTLLGGAGTATKLPH